MLIFQAREEQMKKDALEREEIYRTPTPEPRINSTWLEEREFEVSINAFNFKDSDNGKEDVYLFEFILRYISIQFISIQFIQRYLRGSRDYI